MTGVILFFALGLDWTLLIFIKQSNEDVNAVISDSAFVD